MYATQSILRLVAVSLLFLIFGPATAWADKTPAVDFEKSVWPILQAHCISCHGPDSQQGELRLDGRAAIVQGGISGPAVVPGQLNKSQLYSKIRDTDPAQRMPLDEDPLTADQITLLADWISQGAQWPEGVGSVVIAGPPHWAYQAVERPQLPSTRDTGWLRNPIDAFVLARLEAAGREPSGEAEPRRLARRLYLDLAGIPPSIDEVEAFVNSTDPLAYERLVDSLLASPRYGERWARPWLDLARYADSNGYQADQYRNVWPYRDWVINALNADMPFDQFTVEQLAGDLLPEATLGQKVATGFHRLTTCNVEAGVDPEANRVNQVFDRVNTTGTVWLGTTVICMQCHNHKYDPLTQREYYQLFAFFNNTPMEVEGNGVTYEFTGPRMPLPLDPSQEKHRNLLTTRRDELQANVEARIAQLDDAQAEWESDLVAQLGRAPQWHPLEVFSFESSGGASHELLEDRSVLVGGEKPDRDIYTVTLSSDIEEVTGFKLETLTDQSLPAGGPGRHHPDRPNFILNEFTIEAIPAGSEATPVKLELHSPSADFSQQGWNVAGISDGDPKTGWGINPQFGKPHCATLLLAQPVGGMDWRFVVRLVQNHGEGRTIGRLRLSAMTGTAQPGFPAELRKTLDSAADKRTAAESKKLTDYYHKQDQQLVKLNKQLAQTNKRLTTIAPITTLVMVEQQEPRETRVFRRGNFKDPLQPVQPSTPGILPEYSSGLPASRLGLARWLVDGQNPLTARVAVNRWWAEIFGRGIVATEEDFGTQGDAPTHPGMLDWLALELSTKGWSMKHVHRLLVTSATYRQSSVITPEQLELDPSNLLLGRGPRFRLPAESIRDNALAVSGLLDGQMHGPPIYPPQPTGVWRHVGRNAPVYKTSTDGNRFRRGIYVVWRRSAPYPSFTNFDAPDRTSCVVKRSRTNTPMQALTLLNDQAYVEIAQHLAERIRRLPGLDDDRQRMVAAFQLVVARRPTDRELDVLLDYYQSRLDYYRQNPGQSAELLAGIEITDGQRPELAAWFFVANVLLNLDETITKG